MRILFSPSEAKRADGNRSFKIDELFASSVLSQARRELLALYRSIIKRGDIAEISRLFGIKGEEELSRYMHEAKKSSALGAIRRYCGVAFEYLDYDSLPISKKGYLDENLIIFSNLLGPLAGGDLICNYKLKQGQPLGELKTQNIYKRESQDFLDEYLDGHFILDLRASFYDKFYKPKIAHTTAKFLKNNKSVSHWAKAYRGILARECAIANVKNLDDLLSLKVDSLQIADVVKNATKTLVVYQITR